MAHLARSSFFGVTMPTQHIKKKQHKDKAAAADKPTQRQALAEALRHLGPKASHLALAQFVKEKLGMELSFYLLLPKGGTARKRAVL
jgi:hypothetical protein